MNASTQMSDEVRQSASFFRRLLVATVLAGTLDITYACVVSFFRGRMPLTVLQSVATGWIGPAAYSGGVGTALLGLITHYGIMSVMAATFGLAAARMARLRQRPWSSGLLYGAGLYAVMYGIVLPLRFPAIFPRLNGWITVSDIFVHVGVGLIIARVFCAAAGEESRRTPLD
jgi:hypothetical protein